MQACGAAHAAIYVVNTTDVDLPQHNMALANCDANPMLVGDQCTLRAAIMLANASTGPHTIVLPLNSTITLTQSGSGGAETGDLDILQPMTITGAPAGFPQDYATLPRIQAQFADRLFDVTQNVAVTFRGLTLADGAPAGLAGTNGGAIRITASGAQIEVDRVRFTGNSANVGAAVSNGGTLTIDRSDFVLNQAFEVASAIQTTSTGSTTLRRSSVRNNRNHGVTFEALNVATGGTLVLENSYLDGTNFPIDAPPSSGIRANRPAMLTLRNATFTGFTSRALDLVGDGATQVRVYNSILAGSGETDCSLSVLAGPAPDLAFEWNLIQQSACGAAVGASNRLGVPAFLGSAQPSSNRFFTFRTPQFDSQAIDSGALPDAPGSDPLRLCLAADMLDTPRPVDGNADGIPRCDIGSIEASSSSSSTYVVNVYDEDLVDATPGDDICDVDLITPGPQCTLRAAVMEANAKPGPDRIVFGGGGGARMINLTRAGVAGGADLGDLDVNEQLSIEGVGHPDAPASVQITAVPGDRVFDVSLPAGQAFRLGDVRVAGGVADSGGGVRVAATLAEFERVDFFGNQATSNGGGLWASGDQLVVRDSHFDYGQAADQGAGIHSIASLTRIENSSMQRNAGGAALSVAGTASMEVVNSTLHANSAGIRASAVASVDVRASTIANNDQVGLQVVSGVSAPAVAVRGTVFAGNLQPCQFVGFVAAGNAREYNRVDVFNAACAPVGSGSSVGDAMLAPASRLDTGRVSRYLVPLHGSALIDAIPGDAGPLLCAGKDQRGLDRPIDGDGNGDARCDIGAVELTAQEAGPRQFVVNVDFDEQDSDPGDGICRIWQGDDFCSLRAAVMEANALPGADLIILPPSATPYQLTNAALGGPPDASGGLRISDGVTIRGTQNDAANRPTIQANHFDRIFEIVGVHTPVIIQGLRLAGGQTLEDGGAIKVLNSSAVTLRQLEIHDNSALTGGGALAASSATMLILDSDLHHNTSNVEGGAIRAESSYLTLRRSSIRENAVDDVDLAARAALYATGIGLTLALNSTFSGNVGTAMRIDGGDLSVNNTTIVGNSRRGIEFSRLDDRVLVVRNTVLSGNGLGACALIGMGNAAIATDGYNLTQGIGCQLLAAGTSNIADNGPVLGPMIASPDGYSAYHVPLAGSALRDAGHPDISALGCESSDQRGTPRPIDGDDDGIARCDIGAIEAALATSPLFANGFE
jgi:hypothetical protein